MGKWPKSNGSRGKWPNSAEECMMGLQNTEAGILDLYQLNLRDDLVETLVTSIIIGKDR